MNVKKAIKLVRERYGWIVEPTSKKNVFMVRYGAGDMNPVEKSARDIIRDARCLNGDRGYGFKRNVKHFGKRKNRAATRGAIAKKEFDALPRSPKGLRSFAKNENVWGWD
jgi:hypothetical protein